ncbi:hypothetical protein B0H17DRAFT_1140510 [Mycena rosella]|uniref:Uncharacterized protein n=1 Tax=Mycena rosella TaxID=1033263 RepID=A0AAD7D2B5_MYCRO|nr:hypothetical protein B0H17DRAFT_1140510 [Mycena rosella]
MLILTVMQARVMDPPVTRDHTPMVPTRIDAIIGPNRLAEAAPPRTCIDHGTTIRRPTPATRHPRPRAPPRTISHPIARVRLLDGHPVFPSPNRWSTPRSWGPDGSFPAHEAQRRLEATAKVEENANTTILPIHLTEASLVGPWHGITISSYTHAYNFELWILLGCPYTWNIGDPTAERTEGKAYILSRQQRYQDDHRLRVQHTEGRTSPDSTRRPLVERLAPPAGTRPSPTRGPVYNGPADPSNPPTVVKTRVHQTETWPRGVRTEIGQIPRTSNALPNVEDLVCLNTLQALAPNALEDRELYDHFMTQAYELLSVPGYFHRIIQFGEYPEDFLPMSPYPFGTEHLDHCAVAAWLVIHGISPSSDDFGMLQSFAQSARRQDDGPAPSNDATEFNTRFPQSTNEVVRLPESSMIHRDALDFGPLREGLVSAVPSQPYAQEDAVMTNAEDDQTVPTDDDHALLY